MTMNSDQSTGVWQQNEYGRWVPAEPLPGTFGLRWEQMMRHRRKMGQGKLRALVGGWRDVRAVDRLAFDDEQQCPVQRAPWMRCSKPVGHAGPHDCSAASPSSRASLGTEPNTGEDR